MYFAMGRDVNARRSAGSVQLDSGSFFALPSTAQDNFSNSTWQALRAAGFCPLRVASEAFMFSFPLIKRWQGVALLLLTIQVPAFAQGIDLQNTRSFEGGPINKNTVN